MAKSKKKVAKKGTTKKAKPVTAVVAEERPFRLDMELATHNPDGTTSYSWAQRIWAGEDQVKESAIELRKIGVGGRVVHLDGSSDGVVIEEWFGVERMAAAKAKESMQ